MSGTTVYLANTGTQVENPHLQKLLQQEPLLAFLTDTLLITQKGTLFCLSTNRQCSQIKDLCVQYSL